MPHENDVVILELSDSLGPQDLVAGLDDSLVVVQLRGADLGPVVVIALEAAGGAASVAQVIVARREIATFVRRLLHRMRHLKSNADNLHIELALGDLTAEVSLDDPKANDHLIEAILNLLRVAAERSS